MKNKDHPKYILSCTEDKKFSDFHNVLRTPDMVGTELRKRIGISNDAKGRPTRQLQIFSSYPGMVCTTKQLLNVFLHCKIRNENLIIDRVTEPNLLWDGTLLTSRNTFDIIHQCLVESGFDPKRLLLILGTHSGKESYENWLKHKNIPSKYHYDVLIGYHWLEQMRYVNINARAVHVDKEFDFNKDYVNTGKPKHFTCFNGRLRPSKAKVAEWFFKNGFFTDKKLKETHISSFCFQNIDNKHKYYLDNPEMFKVMPRNVESKGEYYSRYADDSDAPDTEEFEHAQKSAYFDFVVDYIQHEDWTNMSEYSKMKQENPWWDEWMLSEKLYKNLFSKRPFIILGQKGGLNFLHELGFKTFPFLFDESYDNIDDYNLRFRAITSQIKKIATTMTISDLHNIVYSDECQEILAHNRQHGIKKSEEIRQEYAHAIHRFMFK